jgi:hypothetical protein
MAGILYIIDFYVDLNNLVTNIETLILLPLIPFGPHIKYNIQIKPIREYTPKLDRNIIGKENKNRTIISQ